MQDKKMGRKNIAEKKPTRKASPERPPIPWRYRFLTLVCGLLLVVGFFFAARQHFASFDFRVKNSRLKKQIEELEADKRRLLLAKEKALSHTEIKKAAKKIGLTDAPANRTTENKTAAAPPTAPLPEKSRPEKSVAEKQKQMSEVAVKIAEPKKELKKPVGEIKKIPEAKDKSDKIKAPQTVKK